MNRKLVKEVPFVFFQDDANGQWGACPKATYDPDNGFNAFWDGRGIFHDVFEHSHEHTGFFTGQYAMNIGGEMAAMGANMYYLHGLGLHERNAAPPNSIYTPSQHAMWTTLGLVQESIQDGYTRFGSTLECGVPRQPEPQGLESYCLESMLEEYLFILPKYKVTTKYPQEREAAVKFKRSVGRRKIIDLHRYGWRMAEEIAPDGNYPILKGFIEWWDKFCKRTDAEQLATWFDGGMVVRVYHDDDGIISWTGELVGKYGQESIDVMECPW